MKITAEIVPIPLARTKINTANKGRFLPPSSQHFKRDLGIIAQKAMVGQKIFTGAINIYIDLYKNCTPTSKRYGDADNHAKAVLDALNNIVFADDAQVVHLQVHKYKCKQQGLQIDILQATENLEVEEWRLNVLQNKSISQQVRKANAQPQF